MHIVLLSILRQYTTVVQRQQAKSGISQLKMLSPHVQGIQRRENAQAEAPSRVVSPYFHTPSPTPFPPRKRKSLNSSVKCPKERAKACVAQNTFHPCPKHPLLLPSYCLLSALLVLFPTFFSASSLRCCSRAAKACLVCRFV